MKVNYKQTVKVGFAFAIICLFWNAYDFVVPLLLDTIYGLPDDIRGLIMGLDNLLSLFLLPLFGNLSDKSKNKMGRRTPFVVFGTLAALILMIFVPIASHSQLKTSNALRQEITSSVDSNMLTTFYDDAKSGKNVKYCDIVYLNDNKITREDYIQLNFSNITKEGKGENTKYFLDGEQIEASEYNTLSKTNTQYNKFVKSGLNTYIADQIYHTITLKNLWSLVMYMVVLLLVLIAMATFRSPAIALMPDVTPKPLRSQANAIISLAGGIGGAVSFLVYTIWFAINKYAYIEIFATNALAMLILLLFFIKLVKEPKMVEECKAICKANGIVDETPLILGIKQKMDPAKKRSFLLILASIFMWFMGYNAVTSNLSIYCTRNLLFEPSVAGLISAVSLGFSAIAFIPVGYMAVKFGRKRSIIFGFILSAIAFFLTFLLVRPDWTKFLFMLFYLIANFGLIIANVNTFPMVVELATDGDVGKYTGFYYTATMSAQAITPYIAGLFMKINAEYLFIYSAVCVVIAIGLMTMVKHGDSKPLKQEVVKDDI